MKKIKVGAVSYLNTKPLLYGIEHSRELMQQIELIKEYPSKIAKKLLDDEIDVGLVPVAVIPQMKEHYIISDFCIGAEGNVASVCLFSEVDMGRIEKVLLDYQSRTSVALCKLLFKHHWKKDVLFEDAKGDFAKQVEGNIAAVLIGDRALLQREKSKYIYDLGGEWKAMTGLPFVFAAWISNKKLPDEFIFLFNEKNSEGIKNIDAVIKENACSFYDLHTYYTKNISYVLNDEKRKGLDLFLKLLQQK